MHDQLILMVAVGKLKKLQFFLFFLFAQNDLPLTPFLSQYYRALSASYKSMANYQSPLYTRLKKQKKQTITEPK